MRDHDHVFLLVFEVTWKLEFECSARGGRLAGWKVDVCHSVPAACREDTEFVRRSGARAGALSVADVGAWNATPLGKMPC